MCRTCSMLFYAESVRLTWLRKCRCLWSGFPSCCCNYNFLASAPLKIVYIFLFFTLTIVFTDTSKHSPHTILKLVTVIWPNVDIRGEIMGGHMSSLLCAKIQHPCSASTFDGINTLVSKQPPLVQIHVGPRFGATLFERNHPMQTMIFCTDSHTYTRSTAQSTL